MRKFFTTTHLLERFVVALLFLIFFSAISSNATLAYQPPVSNTFMPPYCSPQDTRYPECLYIDPSTCDYFVAKSGNDSWSGIQELPSAPNGPFATIQKGVNQLSAGDTLCIKGYADGTSYLEEVIISNKIGTAQQQITIGGYEPDKRVINDGKFVERINGYIGITINNARHVNLIAVESTRFKDGISATNIIDIDFINVKVYANWKGGINIVKGDNQRIRIENSEIFDNIRSRPEWDPKWCIIGKEGCTQSSCGTCNNTCGCIGGGGVQMHGVNSGSFRNNKLYRNFGEGLNIGRNANTIIIENNLFSENDHTAFYINAASNILYHRNLSICTGEKPEWHTTNNIRGDNDNLGTAVTYRNEQGNTMQTLDEGGNNAVINNVVMGCTAHFVIGAQVDKPGFTPKKLGSALIANNTFIDARAASVTNPKKATFLNIQNNELIYPEPVVFQNNIFKFVDTSAALVGSTASVNLAKIQFANNLTDGVPGFSEGITKVASLPFVANYDHTTFKGTKPKPWQLDSTQLANILNRIKLTSSSPAISQAKQVPAQFLTLYSPYLAVDYFGNARGNNPDIGAHEFGGAPGPNPTDDPSATSDWDLNNDDDVDVHDFSHFVKAVLGGSKNWSELSSFLNAFSAAN
jgi:hypothetical protein